MVNFALEDTELPCQKECVPQGEALLLGGETGSGSVCGIDFWGIIMRPVGPLDSPFVSSHVTCSKNEGWHGDISRIPLSL